VAWFCTGVDRRGDGQAHHVTLAQHPSSARQGEVQQAREDVGLAQAEVDVAEPS
jgi:hypothetical protein